jgi:DNA helicase-4
MDFRPVCRMIGFLICFLSESDQFENGEERRLFYVAMTRAKHSLYLFADASYKSKFITELELGYKGSEIEKCPKCKTADLIKRSGVTNGKPWSFTGCTNFMYGCDFKRWDKAIPPAAVDTKN